MVVSRDQEKRVRSEEEERGGQSVMEVIPSTPQERDLSPPQQSAGEPSWRGLHSQCACNV